MTELMQCIYDYALSTRFCTDAYRSLDGPLQRSVDGPLQRSLDTLVQSLSEAQRSTLRTYCGALEEQRDLELEAMFQAGFSVCREMAGG